jgi:hypothetical protein
MPRAGAIPWQAPRMRAVRIEGPAGRHARRAGARGGTGEVMVRVRRPRSAPTDRLATRSTPEDPRSRVVASSGQDQVGVQPNVGCGRCASCALGTGESVPDHGHRDRATAVSPSGSWCPRPVVPLERFPGPRALDRTARVLPPRGGDARRGRTNPPSSSGRHAQGHRDVGASGGGRAGGGRAAVEARRRLAPSSAPTPLEPGADVEAALGSRPLALVTVPSVEALSWALESVDVRVGSMRSPASPAALRSTPTSCTTAHLRLVGSTGSTVADYRRARDMAASDRSRSSDCRRDRRPGGGPGILLDPTPPRTLRFVARP